LRVVVGVQAHRGQPEAWSCRPALDGRRTPAVRLAPRQTPKFWKISPLRSGGHESARFELRGNALERLLKLQGSFSIILQICLAMILIGALVYLGR
jgi:hypothetical protein